MQDLVENYVLDNDKLRTQMRIAKLESQKYTVLLAGKEEEIKKYKTEMAAFQRQICEQLEIIRSKASENQVENAFTAIARHTNLLCQTDLESLPSESNQLSRSVTKTSLDSLSSDRHQEDKCAFSVQTVVDAESKEMTTVTNCGHNSIDENSCGSDHSQPRSSNAICTVKRSARKSTSLQNGHDIPARMLSSNSSDECGPKG
ncbi:hypothetical protein RUM44_013979 [Polyplax serrata]|uniref:Uncharacterized protein n=1 Tax=Polyplax serrata TaxID=468196 RepID=A0ABR1BFR1_POLSC